MKNCPVCNLAVSAKALFGPYHVVACFNDEEKPFGINELTSTHWPVCCRTGYYETEEEAAVAWEENILL